MRVAWFPTEEEERPGRWEGAEFGADGVALSGPGVGTCWRSSRVGEGRGWGEGAESLPLLELAGLCFRRERSQARR